VHFSQVKILKHFHTSPDRHNIGRDKEAGAKERRNNKSELSFYFLMFLRDLAFYFLETSNS
jgi:hypothetical protein